MATITKRQIAERIAKRVGQTQTTTKDVVQQFLDEVVAELGRGNKLEFRDFGIFEVVTRRSRTGRNPRTGETVFVPAKQVVSFKMGRRMSKAVVSGANAAVAHAQAPVSSPPPQEAPLPADRSPSPNDPQQSRRDEPLSSEHDHPATGP